MQVRQLKRDVQDLFADIDIDDLFERSSNHRRRGRFDNLRRQIVSDSRTYLWPTSSQDSGIGIWMFGTLRDIQIPETDDIYLMDVIAN